jgi:hypothetical protein
MQNLKNTIDHKLAELDNLEATTTRGGYWFLIPLALYLFDNRQQFLKGMAAGIHDFQ